MRTSISHIPAKKQEELRSIVQCISSNASIELVILFGSYARGNWIEEYADDGIHFQYQSDFDLLVLVETGGITEQHRLEQKLEDVIDQLPKLNTPVSIIVHDVEYVNARIAKAQYFFSDIKREGILLYDSGKFKIKKVRRLNPKDRYHLAKEDFEDRFEKAKDLKLGFQFYFDNKKYNLAAFSLHQVTENLYNTILLVFTRYKPKTHDLRVLRKLVNALDNRLIKVFPLSGRIDRHRFELLRRAYVDARYSKGYIITHEELDWLAKQVEVLEQLVEKLCQEKLDNFLML